MAKLTRVGYGQVEPNQLSAQKNGQIYASLPLSKEVNVLQNGEFMYYNYVTKEVSSKGIGEPMLVFNEIKLYQEQFRETYKNFAMIRVGDNYVTSGLAAAAYGDGALNEGAVIDPVHTDYDYRMDGIAPRLFKTSVGDIYTTNMVKADEEYAVGDILAPVENTESHTLVLEKSGSADSLPTGMAWAVVKVYTMPDGQPGLKLQRVQ